MNIFKCCYKCPKRYVGCHSACPEYKLLRQALSDQAELIRKTNAVTIYHHDLYHRNGWDKVSLRNKYKSFYRHTDD